MSGVQDGALSEQPSLNWRAAGSGTAPQSPPGNALERVMTEAGEKGERRTNNIL